MTRSAALRFLAALKSRTPTRVPDRVATGEPLDSLATELFAVTSNQRPLSLTSHSVAHATSELEFRLEFERPHAGLLRLDAKHLRLLPDGYLNALTLTFEPPRSAIGQKFLHAEDSAFEVSLAPQTALSEPWGTRFVHFAEFGILHVLGGYDHLLFLVGVLVPCRRTRTLLGLITCFTVAHSLTLLASALGGMDAPSRIVEPLIAASILYVGIENLIVRDEPRSRYVVTFLFGLVHGLGFATALQGVGTGDAALLPILSFNLGVEFGQLSVAALLLPLLAWLRRRPSGVLAGQMASLAVALGGGYWVIERLFSA